MSPQPRPTLFVPTLELRAADSTLFRMDGHGKVHDQAQAGGRAPAY